jgi:hypothetical protein
VSSRLDMGRKLHWTVKCVTLIQVDRSRMSREYSASEKGREAKRELQRFNKMQVNKERERMGRIALSVAVVLSCSLFSSGSAHLSAGLGRPGRVVEERKNLYS